jgi:aminoglycoside phosphotransferase (APT) family kinase protein
VDSGEPVGTTATVGNALRAALPDVAPTGPAQRLPRGYGSESWRVATEAGLVLVKIAVRWPTGERLPNAAEAARLAAACGVRTPQVLAIADRFPDFGGRSYSVWEYLDGEDAGDALDTMDERAVEGYFELLGSALGRLHQCVAPHYSRTVTSSQGQRTLTEAVAARLNVLEARYIDVGLRFDNHAREASRRVAALVADVSPESAPVLVHGDLYPDNLLVGLDGSPVLLDFELGSFADAGFEFFKPTVFIFERYRPARAALLAAYSTAGATPDLDRRIEAALGLGLLWGIPFFHRWKDDDVSALFASRLSEWLERAASS